MQTSSVSVFGFEMGEQRNSSDQLLASDFVPDEKVTLSLRAVIDQQEDEMGHLDRKILRLAEQIIGLYAQKASIQRLYEVNRAIVAPVRKLPPEILAEIFVHCLPGGCQGQDFAWAPLLMMRVCGRWRRIAAGTPRLWTRLDDAHGAFDPCRTISLWLSNSGTLPITLSLSPSQWSQRRNKDEVAQLLVDNLCRLRHFSWNVNASFYEKISRHDHPIHVLSLESFTLSVDRRDATSASPPPELRGCIRAPRLSSVGIDYLSTLDLIAFDPISLRSVSLTLQPGTSNDTLSLLQSLKTYPNLSDLRIGLDGVHLSPIPEGHPRIMFPCLETLHVHSWRSNPCDLLNALEVPVLWKLKIGEIHQRRVPHLMPTLISLVGGRATHLQELSFNMFRDFDSVGCVSLLTKLQGLRSLSMKGCAVDDLILQALIQDPSSPADSWICPRLSSLDISVSSFSQDIFVRLVRVRAPAKANISVSGRQCLRYVDVRKMKTEENQSCITDLEGIARECGGLLQIEW